MKQSIIIFVFSIAFVLNLNAQNESRVLNYAPTSDISIINDALYTDIEFVDDRPDVEYDALKINADLVQSQLKRMLNSATMNTMSKNGKLLFQLRNLRMEDLPEKGKAQVNFRANLYERKGDDYYLVNSFESRMIMPDKKHYQEVLSNYIMDYIVNNLKETIVEEELYTIDDVHNVSFIEKQLIPLYTEDSLKDGVYATFKEFANQEPLPYEITPKFKDDELKEIKIPSGKNGKLTKVSPKDTYAVVVGGQPYVGTDKKYIPLYQDGDDFFFEDEVAITVGANVGTSILVGIATGLTTGVAYIPLQGQKKIQVTFVIDHLNGARIALPE